MNVVPALYFGSARLLAFVARLGSKLLAFAFVAFAIQAGILLVLAQVNGHGLSLDGAYVVPALRAAAAFAILHGFCRLMAYAVAAANRRGQGAASRAI